MNLKVNESPCVPSLPVLSLSPSFWDSYIGTGTKEGLAAPNPVLPVPVVAGIRDVLLAEFALGGVCVCQ